MAKKKKKKHLTRDERIAKEYPDGFNVQTYSSIAQFIGSILGLILAILLLTRVKLWINTPDWIGLIAFFFFAIFGWVLGQKLFGATVNLKVTNAGLEQKRVDGSFLVPKERFIEWDNMRSCLLNGEYRWSDFYIKTKKGRNYRMTTTYLLRRFSDYDDAFFDFRHEFERCAENKHVPIKDKI